MAGQPKSPRISIVISRLVRLLLIALILVLSAFGPETSVVRYLDDQIASFRFAMAPRDASGQIVYVAIDKSSLESVGVWPWPRSTYAAIINKLTEAKASDIVFDIDFSTPSSLSEDESFASALSAAGGGVVLPVFRQFGSATDKTSLSITRPIPLFETNAWLAFANVTADLDGLIRRFEFGDLLDGQQAQSVASVLARSSHTSGSSLIDFSIRPSTVPTISLSDLLSPEFNLASIEGRSVIVGAFATELKDIFSVPVYGQLPGPMLHILAAETLLQGRALAEPDLRPIDLALAALVIAISLGLQRLGIALAGALAVTSLCGLEVLAYFLQKDAGIVVDTATSWTVVGLGLILLLTERLDLSRLVAEIANAEQRNIRRLLRKIVSDSTDAVLAFDHQFVIFEESDSAYALLGLEVPTKGKTLWETIPASLHQTLRDLAVAHRSEPKKVHSASGRFSVEHGGSKKHLDAVLTVSPAERPSDQGDELLDAFIGSVIVRDMTARHIYEERLKHLADHDELTGLMNRRAFSEFLHSLREPSYVLAVGLHRLGVINTTMGRAFGDSLLRAVATRLQSQTNVAAVGRLGGDVFAVAIPSGADGNLQTCAEAFLGAFDAPIKTSGSAVNVSVRIGATETSDQVQWGATVVEQSELALEEAKAVAGSGWSIYDPNTAQQQRRSRDLEYSMRDSLNGGEFSLAYQPQIELATGELVGAEALLRWNHPEFGMVSPATFIAIAEANGFICDLGRWALREACCQAASWPARMNIAVNVSPIQLVKADIVADVELALAASGLNASRLHLEITESTNLHDSGTVLESLRKLREMGIAIALDDFGTGYSSLSYLAGLPLDKLKIDQSFVRKMASDPQSLAIVQMVKALANGLDLSVVAEGVETKLESELLRAMGCEVGQGYFYGKPQPSSELLVLAERAPWRSAA